MMVKIQHKRVEIAGAYHAISTSTAWVISPSTAAAWIVAAGIHHDWHFLAVQSRPGKLGQCESAARAMKGWFDGSIGVPLDL